MSLESALASARATVADLEALTAPAITTADALDRALAGAVSGATIVLSPTLIYPAPLVLRQPVVLQTLLVQGRMDLATPLPRFTGGLTVAADQVRCIGLEVRHPDPGTDIITMTGAAGTVLDSCRVLGDPLKGAKRGVAANGNGGCQIVRCYVDDCFQPSPGYDSQAIAAWDCGAGLLIEDNFLRAGSETILLGGADSVSLARVPSDVVIRRNTITARPEWRVLPVGVKTRLELKAARRVLIEGNAISQCWVQGQAGYLVSFTVKNQDGGAPWSVIEDVVFQDNTVSDGPAALNILATDYAHPSGTLARLTIRRNHFTVASDIAYQESQKLVQVIEGTADLTFDANTFEGAAIGSQIYFSGTAKTQRTAVTDNQFPASLYGIFGSGVSVGIDPATGLPWAWGAHVEGGTFSGNTTAAAAGA